MHAKVEATTPLFLVSDLQRSVDFYHFRLGYRDPCQWGEPPCFAMLNRDGFDLMLSLAADPTMVRPNGPSGVWDMYLRVADLQAEMAALEKSGVPLVKGPTKTFYDMLEIEIIDPDGYRICIAQTVVE